MLYVIFRELIQWWQVLWKLNTKRARQGQNKMKKENAEQLKNIIKILEEKRGKQDIYYQGIGLMDGVIDGLKYIYIQEGNDTQLN